MIDQDVATKLSIGDAAKLTGLSIHVIASGKAFSQQMQQAMESGRVVNKAGADFTLNHIADELDQIAAECRNLNRKIQHGDEMEGFEYE